MTTHFLGDTAVLLGRSLRHITRSLDTIITTTIMPIAFLLLFVYVLGGAVDTGSERYVNYLLPGILLITIASGISYTAFRLFLDMKSGIFERFQSMPIARSSVLWAHVLTSLAANLVSLVVVVLVALLMGLPLTGGSTGMARGRRHLDPRHPDADVDRRHLRSFRKVRGRCGRVLLPTPESWRTETIRPEDRPSLVERARRRTFVPRVAPRLQNLCDQFVTNRPVFGLRPTTTLALTCDCRS